ncbi:hypothetical protein [Candidatus Agathobaculum pullicola]|uniref:hypothetical protein n=1 Tax=Candidatus Agathobaculum pullicola TaxID=2838426 RepID=UPI003F92D989
MVIPGGVPAIVPQDLFDRVQTRVERNKRTPSGTSRTGVKHYYYKCSGAQRKLGRDKRAVRKKWIVDIVVERTMCMILSDTVVEDIAALVMAE